MSDIPLKDLFPGQQLLNQAKAAVPGGVVAQVTDLGAMVQDPSLISRKLETIQKMVTDQTGVLQHNANEAKDNGLKAAEDLFNAAKQQVSVTKDRLEKAWKMLTEQSKADPTAAQD